MSQDNQYDFEELERRYEGLEEDERKSLRSHWQDIVIYLDQTDRDWVKKSYIQDQQDIGASFSPAYDGFLKVFDPSTGSGGAFAFYEIDYDDMIEAAEAIGLPEVTLPSDKQNPIDEYLKGDYSDDSELI